MSRTQSLFLEVEASKNRCWAISAILRSRFCSSLLGALADSIPEGQRVVTIEDMAELRLTRRHIVPLEARPANSEGKGEVPIRSLVKNALRMRPDRIIVGEVRGDEVLDMLQAMNTGHDGSLTTVHANSARDALARLESLVVLSGVALPVEVIRLHMLSVFQMVIQTARLQDGTRRILGICELLRNGGNLELRAVYEYEQQGVDAGGMVIGRFVGPLCEPTWLERFAVQGLPPLSAFGGKRACG